MNIKAKKQSGAQALATLTNPNLVRCNAICRNVWSRHRSVGTVESSV